MTKGSFTRKEHLKKNSLIRAVFDKGTPLKAKFITVYILKRKTDTQPNRVAFIIRKRLCDKRAVLRNRFRRVLREAYRRRKHLLSGGHDLIILGATIKKDTKSPVIERELRDVFKKYCKK
ncbi:MAG: ribonuclease P protein component [Candidatus Omnitrophica bacterium]|nr:ribonuclease P protein component [Candidatus Omnitrophota bacterium]